MIFKNPDNAVLFWLIICDFFSKYHRTGVFNQSEIGYEHAPNFLFSENKKVEKKFRFGRVTMAKSIKTEKTKELTAGYQ